MQQVHINRLGTNSIEFEHKVVEMQLPVNSNEVAELILLNYGAPSHIQIFVSNELKETVFLTENKIYVEYEEYIPLQIKTGLKKVPIIGTIYVVIENQTQNSNLDYKNEKDNGFVFFLTLSDFLTPPKLESSLPPKEVKNKLNIDAFNIFIHNIQDIIPCEIQEKRHNSNLNSYNKTENIFYKTLNNIKNIKIQKIFSKGIKNTQLTLSWTDISAMCLLIILFYMINILQGYYQFYTSIAFSAIFTTLLLHLSIKIMNI